MWNRDYWWPLNLSHKVESYIYKIFSQGNFFHQSIDHGLFERADSLLNQFIKLNINEILERDGLPHLSHLICGWGNAIVDDRCLLSYVADFIHLDKSKPYFFQCEDEGDFHPWQSFAYFMMAGIDKEYQFGQYNISLKDLALNSNRITVSEGRELGHLLFGLSSLYPYKVKQQKFFLEDGIYSTRNLIESAIEAHFYGTFEVCRKFHLTEGLCAIAAKIPFASIYRKSAQGFLDGQMDILYVLSTILYIVENIDLGSNEPATKIMLTELRNSIVIDHYIENHYYYAGHLIELASFAILLGYKVSNNHFKTIRYIINRLNKYLIEYLPYLSLQECFLALAHYRRAITLFSEIDRDMTKVKLNKYTVDFNNITYPTISNSKLIDKPKSVSDGGTFDITSIERKESITFNKVIASYNGIRHEDFKLRGTYTHFRRIIPPNWPRSLHYEFLDYGNNIGVEIHIENENLKHLFPLLKTIQQDTSELNGSPLELDHSWYKNGGRLRALYKADSEPSEIAGAMKQFINLTYNSLNEFLKTN